MNVDRVRASLFSLLANSKRGERPGVANGNPRSQVIRLGILLPQHAPFDCLLDRSQEKAATWFDCSKAGGLSIDVRDIHEPLTREAGDNHAGGSRAARQFRQTEHHASEKNLWHQRKRHPHGRLGAILNEAVGNRQSDGYSNQRRTCEREQLQKDCTSSNRARGLDAASTASRRFQRSSKTILCKSCLPQFEPRTGDARSWRDGWRRSRARLGAIVVQVSTASGKATP